MGNSRSRTPCLTVSGTAHSKSSPLPPCSPNDSEGIDAAAQHFVHPALLCITLAQVPKEEPLLPGGSPSSKFVPPGHITSCFSKAMTCDCQHGCPHQCWQHRPVTPMLSRYRTSAHSWPLSSPPLTSHVLSGPWPCLLRVLILLA